MPERIYLAAPYSHDDPAVRTTRFDTVTRIAGDLMQSGALVFSPITHGHPVSERGELPGDFAYWEAACLSHLALWATTLYVLTLPGWRESRGVTAEIDAAAKAGLPIVYLQEEPA